MGLRVVIEFNHETSLTENRHIQQLYILFITLYFSSSIFHISFIDNIFLGLMKSSQYVKIHNLRQCIRDVGG